MSNKWLYIFISTFLGITMLFPPWLADNIEVEIRSFSPLWLMGVIFIAGGIVGARKSRRWIFILSVSVPLALFASFVLLAFLHSSSYTLTGVFTYGLLAIFSGILAGTEFDT